MDLNQRPFGYEPNELPGCSTPRYKILNYTNTYIYYCQEAKNTVCYNILMVKKILANKTLIAVIATLLFVLVNIPFVMHHEHWNDEAISWAISRDLTPTNVYDLNSSEPQPFLWQLILAPFSKLDFSIDVVSFISLAVVALAVFLFVRFAKINLFTKIAFLSSIAFFYFLPSIAKNYSLVPLAIALVCIAYKNRHENPLKYGLSIAFLAQTHFLMYGLVLVLSVGFMVEELLNKKDRKNISRFLVPVLASIALVVPIIINAFNNNVVLNGKLHDGIDPKNLPSLASTFLTTLFGNDSYIIGALCFVGLVIFTIALYARSVKAATYFVISELFWTFILGFVYTEYNVFGPRVAMFLLIALAAIWIAKEEDEKENKLAKIFGKSEIVKILKNKRIKNGYVIIATIIALATTPRGIIMAVGDYNNKFTNDVELAEILDTVEDGSLIIEADYVSVINAAVHESIKTNKNLVYFNYNLNKTKEAKDFLVYDNDSVERFNIQHYITNEELSSLLEAATNAYEHVYYLTIPPSCSTPTSANQVVLSEYEPIKTFTRVQYIGTKIGTSVRLIKIK